MGRGASSTAASVSASARTLSRSNAHSATTDPFEAAFGSTRGSASAHRASLSEDRARALRKELSAWGDPGNLPLTGKLADTTASVLATLEARRRAGQPLDMYGPTEGDALALEVANALAGDLRARWRGPSLLDHRLDAPLVCLSGDPTFGDNQVLSRLCMDNAFAELEMGLPPRLDDARKKLDDCYLQSLAVVTAVRCQREGPQAVNRLCGLFRTRLNGHCYADGAAVETRLTSRHELKTAAQALTTDDWRQALLSALQAADVTPEDFPVEVITDHRGRQTARANGLLAGTASAGLKRVQRQMTERLHPLLVAAYTREREREHAEHATT